MPLQVGDTAPDFELPAVTGEKKSNLKLSDFRGKRNVVLAFYPLDWSSTCTAEMPALNAALSRFQGLDAEVVGVSVDSIHSHIAWQEKSIGTLGYPLASDFFPHGKTAKAFGIFRDGDPIPGIAERAIFVVDKTGKVAFSKVYELGELPDVDDVIEAIQKLPK
jgi:peroxiredoxin